MLKKSLYKIVREDKHKVKEYTDGNDKMIKGVNRQIIEISETGNIYYEKAILVVRPQYRDAQQALLEKQAQKMLKNIKAPSAIRKRSMFLYYALRVLIPAGIGALITAGVFQLL